MNFKFIRGFTLIELIVTMAILTALITGVVVVINPAKQFSKANDAKRNSDLNTIMSAIGQYAADNKGNLPAGITTTPTTISNTGVDICSTIVSQYMASFPVDPLTNGGKAISDCTASYTTNYTIVKSATNNRVTISAPATEIGEVISVTR